MPLANKRRKQYRDTWRWWGLLTLCLTPTLWLIGHWSHTANAFAALTSTSGHSAIVCLLASLVISPLQQLAIPRRRQEPTLIIETYLWLLKKRRFLGLASFFYATAHGLIYLYFELDFDWSELWYDITTRAQISLGISGWLILFILAISSPKAMVRYLGKRWRPLHRLTYIAIILTVCHSINATKVTEQLPWLYALISLVLLLMRLPLIWRWIQKNSLNRG